MAKHCEAALSLVSDSQRNFTLIKFYCLYTRDLKKRSHLEFSDKRNMSCIMRKPDFCICKNKGADQLRGNRAADQGLWFSYIKSTIPLLSKYEILNLQPSSVAVQPGLCRAWSEIPWKVLPGHGSYIVYPLFDQLKSISMFCDVDRLTFLFL